MRRLAGVVASAAQPDEPARPTRGSASRSPTPASRRWASRRTRSTASRGSSGRGWPRARRRSETPARAAPSTGNAARDRATSTSCSPRSRRTSEQLEAALARARDAYRDLAGVKPSGARTATRCPPAREPFGFRDGIGHPAIEGSGIPGSNSREPPFKAGEFVLGYPDETGGFPPMPRPDVLGRNGTYVVFRKLHQRVAAFRRYLKENASSPDDEELLAAKMMGRWRSGAPLALCPLHDDPELGADPHAQQRLRVRRRCDRIQDAARRRTSGERIRATRRSPGSSGSTG